MKAYDQEKLFLLENRGAARRGAASPRRAAQFKKKRKIAPQGKQKMPRRGKFWVFDMFKIGNFQRRTF